MRTKIFRSIWLVLVSALLISYALIVGLLYNHFTDEQLAQLRNETKLVSQAVVLNGLDFFDKLGTTDFRITWITADGKVLYDNEADEQAMENHLEREEIRDALQNGYGESRRYSSTLLEQQLYTAQKLPDGTVLRLSVTQTTIWNLFLRFLLPLGAILVIEVILSFVLASSLSRRIVEPLNELNLDSPLENADHEAYTEILPLLRRLDDQHKQLAKDREELEKTSLIRQEFTANASHELKTPLHVISGYAELLESGGEPRVDCGGRGRHAQCERREHYHIRRPPGSLQYHLQFVQQRDPLQRPGRQRTGDSPRFSRPRASHRLRQWNRHSRGRSRQDLRALLPGRQEPFQGSGRHRPRPVDRQARGQGP